jgi:gamma-glutamylcyclotransferase
VWGVVFEIDSRDKADLDKAEGLGNGYDEKQVDLVDSTKRCVRAWMYVASESHKNPSLRPYSWYVRFVLEGARQHGLPADYLALLQQVQSVEDPNRQRDARERRTSCG